MHFLPRRQSFNEKLKKIQVFACSTCENTFLGILLDGFSKANRPPAFDLPSPTGVLTTASCHVDLFEFMKAVFFILTRLVSRNNPEILPK